ncbi:MAG TPA: hypothetical protein VGC74_12980 [Stenotrophomonas sp.]
MQIGIATLLAKMPTATLHGHGKRQRHSLRASTTLALAATALGMLGGCSSVATERVEQRSDAVDQRLLVPTAAGTTAAPSYRMQAGQAFRMPLLQDNVDPALPRDTPRRQLAPTTVCVQVIIDERGSVQRTEPLVDRPECQAGADPANADLLHAVDVAALTWHYIPAAVCHYAGPRPARIGDCADAEHVELVPVTLNYAFSFQMERGEILVRRGDAGGR